MKGQKETSSCLLKERKRSLNALAFDYSIAYPHWLWANFSMAALKKHNSPASDVTRALCQPLTVLMLCQPTRWPHLLTYSLRSFLLLSPSPISYLSVLPCPLSVKSFLANCSYSLYFLSKFRKFNLMYMKHKKYIIYKIDRSSLNSMLWMIIFSLFEWTESFSTFCKILY